VTESLPWHVRDITGLKPHIYHLIDLASACKSIVEIGVYTGASTRALLTGLPADGKMFSVDKNNHQVDDEVRNDPRWAFLLADSVAPATMSQYPIHPDLMFIDSGHTYELTWRELVLAGCLGAKRIALHDYLFPLSEDPYCEVKRATDEFLTLGLYEWQELYDSHWGLAVLRRKE
jgi:hypothetical protein